MNKLIYANLWASNLKAVIPQNSNCGFDVRLEAEVVLVLNADSQISFFLRFHSALMHWNIFFLPHLEEDIPIQIEEIKEGVIVECPFIISLVLCQFCPSIFKALCSVAVSLYEDFTCNGCQSVFG